MSMKPILFNTEMVRAILGGRKTMTRRVVKPKALEKFTNLIWNPNENKCFCPYKPRDILWVRETWQQVWEPETYFDKETFERKEVPIRSVFPNWDERDKKPAWGTNENYWIYRADGEPINTTGLGKICWMPSIHMPRRAARIFLKVKDVRVERLQNITDHDCWAEGVVTDPFDYQIPEYYERYPGESFNRSCFLGLWNSINGKKYPWESNPWVWVIEFERQENAI